MIIPLIEPTSTRYIHVNPATNRVHLLVPFVGGQDISTDNTCRSTAELNAFFGGGGFNELEAYKSVLEFHISLLDANDARRVIKEERLAQINIYLDAVRSIGNNYQTTVNALLAKPSNLYSIHLRPSAQDNYGDVVNPVFTIERGNDGSGTPLSPLYNKMHEVFPNQTLGKPDPRTELINATLSALPQDASFEDIQRVLTEQCQRLFGAPIDFQSYIKRTPGRPSENQAVTKAHIDTLMGLGDDATPEEYIHALLGTCAPNLSSLYIGSPFYHGSYTTPAEQAERLSIMTQFYLAILNIHCRAQGISNINFGEILDNNAALSEALVECISMALTNGDDVEASIIMFVNEHTRAFSLSRDLNPDDKNAIQTKFETTYRTVTATDENEHMDDFMILDNEARGPNALFFTQKGLICTDFANIAPTTGPNQAYFAEIKQEAATHPNVMRPQDEAIVEVDIEPEALMDKLDDIQWDKLPVEVSDACRALPAFQMRELADDVAKGKQEEAEAILNASAADNQQALLTTPAKFTDYSGRTFNCTAYEYAYWAKDTHMRRMLESHMDDTTKTYLLNKIDEMEHSGLAYQQHGVDYKNPHYDMSFVLKDLNPAEFRHLQTMVGQNNPKIQEATANNYQNLPFTATEYEQLQKDLAPHTNVWTWMLSCLGSFQSLAYLTYPAFFLASFFITPPANTIANKLTFDFNSLITALDTYVTNYDRWNWHDRDAAWLKVGQAQRDVPVHIANEYCRPDRSFHPCPEFNERTLPRVFTFDNYVTSCNSWFPLSAGSSGLGVDCGLIRRGAARVGARAERATVRWAWPAPIAVDLRAVTRLDEVRTNDLTQSREILSEATRNHGLGHS
ncbi:MAG: hypothetical protein P1U39_05190 [Legionellaceae bacterium]|nr:hypothetical protein [Legionellaceae bacterium]